MRKSFFERLTGAINFIEKEEKESPSSFNYEAEEKETANEENADFETRTAIFNKTAKRSAENEEDGQLTIDCWKTKDAVMIQSIVAGVKQKDLDVSITLDMVTIKGKRTKQNPPQK